MEIREKIARLAEGLPASFRWLWIGVLISSLATFVFPFLALYLTGRGFDPQRIGLLVSLLGVGAVFAGPLAGTLSDHYGRRPAVLIALVGQAAAAAYLGLVRSPALVAPGVLAFGLCASMAYPAINAAVADMVPADQVVHAYGLLYWANNLGIGLSALVGGVLATKSWLGLFLLDGATTLICAGIVWRRVPESRPTAEASDARDPRGWRMVLADRALIGFLLAHVCFSVVFWQFQFALPIQLARTGHGAASLGLIVATNCIFILIAQPFVTRGLARVPPAALLALSAFFLGAGYGSYMFCTETWHYLLATVLWSCGEVTGLPTAAGLVVKLAPPDLRGRYQGAFSLSFSIAMTVAPIAGGAAISRFGTRALWAGCFALCCAVAAAHLALGAARKERAAYPTGT